MTEKSKRMLSVWIGVGSIVLSLAALIFAKTLPDDAKPLLTVLFAIGAGGIIAGILGFVTVKLPPIGGFAVSAGGGIAFTLLLLYNPPKFFDRHDFAVEIVLKKKNGSSVNGELQMNLSINGVPYQRAFSGEKYRYEGVSARKKDNSTAKLSLPENGKWMFDSALFVKTIPVKETVTELVVYQNPATLRLKGLITANDPRIRVEGIVINVDGYPEKNATTSKDGSFTIQMPDDYTQNQIRIWYVVGKNRKMTHDLLLGDPKTLTLLVK